MFINDKKSMVGGYLTSVGPSSEEIGKGSFFAHLCDKIYYMVILHKCMFHPSTFCFLFHLASLTVAGTDGVAPFALWTTPAESNANNNWNKPKRLRAWERWSIIIISSVNDWKENYLWMNF